MKITWLGQSSFLIEDKRGVKLITDPFDPTIGYDVYSGSADVVLISHHHFDHDYTKMIKGNPDILDKVGNFQLKDIPISGFASYHDEVKGAKRGLNTIYVFEMDGLRLCHLGDIGYVPSPDEIEKLGKIDVLFIPVGGNFTINGKQAAEIAKLINSHIVIPMHYKTPKLTLPLASVEEFISCMKNAEKVNNSVLTIDKELDGFNKVKIFEI